ncbi:glycosyltransferase family 2 protein [Spirosoma aerophilum]
MSPFLNQIKPWVSVICTNYNQKEYVDEALQSVVDQDYPNVELIVIDNGSTDDSATRLTAFKERHPAVQLILNQTNVGLNRAFNQGLALAQGRYIIDLSADDVLLPGRIADQVAYFEELAGPYAVVFSNAAYIDNAGTILSVHYPTDEQGHALTPVPTGNVFQPILESYFICTPTMMMRRDVLNELGGYDETLAYEDFDFWVRSARLYHYAYLDKVLTHKRQVASSLSAQVVMPENKLLDSTLTVCNKAFDRCHTPDEFKALAGRLRTFIRKSFYAEQFDLALQFGELLRQIEQPGFTSSFILGLCRLQVPVNKLYRQYIKFYRASGWPKLV